MTLNDLKKKVLSLIKEQNSLESRHLSDCTELLDIYVYLYDKYPKCCYVEYDIDADKTIEKINNTIGSFSPGSYEYYEEKEGKFVYKEPLFSTVIITTKGILNISINGIYIYASSDKDTEFLLKCLVKSEEENPCEVYWVAQSQNGFIPTKLTLKNGKFNVNSHYNDDFDYNKVQDFIQSEGSGLIILHGTPGTGKTFIIRNLAQENPNKKFYFLDKDTFNYINSDSLIKFLFSNSVKNSILVLEDCETLLADRVENGNHLLSTILNLSDGILGDGLNLKFICTFNADISKLDDAILRKGRLKYKYEFKKLTPEKTQELAKELHKDIPKDLSLTVGDIYNWEDNVGEDNKTKKIGF